jgi:hypothetical protein
MEFYRRLVNNMEGNSTIKNSQGIIFRWCNSNILLKFVRLF